MINDPADTPRCAVCRTPDGLVQTHVDAPNHLICLPDLERALGRVGPPKLTTRLHLTCTACDSDDPARFSVAAIWPYSRNGKYTVGQSLTVSCTRHLAEAIAGLVAERTTGRPTHHEPRRPLVPRYLIETPVPDYVGELGPIHFHAGRADVDEIPGSIRTYCEQAGYTITDTQPAADEDQAADAEAVVR